MGSKSQICGCLGVCRGVSSVPVGWDEGCSARMKPPAPAYRAEAGDRDVTPSLTTVWLKSGQTHTALPFYRIYHRATAVHPSCRQDGSPAAGTAPAFLPVFPGMPSNDKESPQNTLPRCKEIKKARQRAGSVVAMRRQNWQGTGSSTWDPGGEKPSRGLAFELQPHLSPAGDPGTSPSRRDPSRREWVEKNQTKPRNRFIFKSCGVFWGCGFGPSQRQDRIWHPSGTTGSFPRR